MTFKRLPWLIAPLLDLVRMNVIILRQFDQSPLALDHGYRHPIIGKTTRKSIDRPDQMLLRAPGSFPDPPHTSNA